jgi:hypothetical protein
MQIFFWIFGIVGILCFYEGIYLPILVSVLVMIASSGYLIWLRRRSCVGLLGVLLFFVLILPFIHVVAYIWYGFGAGETLMFWKLMFNPYMSEKVIIELTAMIGAVGSAGFIVGATLLPGKVRSPSLHEVKQTYLGFGKTLTLPVFLVWTGIAVGFTWISAPEDTIFTAVYTQSKAINANWNFSSAWMVSYCFILFALADAIFEQDIWHARWKRMIIVLAFALIVIWFQLLRGDRECIPCVFAAALMCCIWGKGLIGNVMRKIKLNGFVIFFGALLTLLVVCFVGLLRSAIVGVTNIFDLWNIINKSGFHLGDIFHGTWSAVLLTPLSVAGDYINGTLPLNWGQTYLDLAGSVIPGFLADWIGYARPIDGLHGPAWVMTYGIGGTHAFVVPFLDFRMAGVFIIVALWSFAFAVIERHALRFFTASNLALLGIVAMAAPHWLWYGEKNIMNALIGWFALSVVYRVLIARKGVVHV